MIDHSYRGFDVIREQGFDIIKGVNNVPVRQGSCRWRSRALRENDQEREGVCLLDQMVLFFWVGNNGMGFQLLA